MSQCFEKVLKVADAELNGVYQKVLRSIDQADALSKDVRAQWRAALVGGQRAWIAFRDADCRNTVPFEWYGGTGAGSAILICLIDKTRTRTSELQDRYLNR
jgi:uncharacterized protein YecT (DUF1311 family)